VRVASSYDKLILDLIRSVDINCTYACDSFEGTDFVYWPSQDRVSISLRSCVNFTRSAQAEILRRFRRDRVSISPGDIVEFIGVRLRFGNYSPRWRIVGREEIEGYRKVAQRS